MPGTSLSASKRVVGPRQAGLLAPDHCRWAPSQGDGLSGSCPRLPGYSDGFAPDSHRLSFSALYLSIFSRWDGASEPPIGVLYLCDAWPASPPPKGERIIGCGERGPRSGVGKRGKGPRSGVGKRGKGPRSGVGKRGKGPRSGVGKRGERSPESLRRRRSQGRGALAQATRDCSK